MLIDDANSWLKAKHPMIIASSGGGGHIVAAESLIQQLEQRLTLPNYHFETSRPDLCSLSTMIEWACQVYHHPKLSSWIKPLTSLYLPKPEELCLELRELIDKHDRQLPKYIDFMLDIQPNGYLFTALFNCLQKIGHPSSLHHLTQQQYWMDRFYKNHVSQKILQLLNDSLVQKKPYDVMLITQPIGLAAICQTVHHYNHQRLALAEKIKIDVPKLFIHLFITDIAYQSAGHYLQPLNSLTPESKHNLIIHTLDLESDGQIIEKRHASKVFLYPPHNFPIIREPFKHLTLEPYLPSIKFKNTVVPLSSDQKVASIMLSSSQGDTTLRYLETLIELEFQHVIIVGPIEAKLQQNILHIQANHFLKTKIYTPGFTNAQTLSSIFRQSQLIILKGGGLSLMELAAFRLKPDSMIFIHQMEFPRQSKIPMGLSWENGNIEWFKHYCQQHHQCTQSGTHTNLKQAYITHYHS